MRTDQGRKRVGAKHAVSHPVRLRRTKRSAGAGGPRARSAGAHPFRPFAPRAGARWAPARTGCTEAVKLTGGKREDPAGALGAKRWEATRHKIRNPVCAANRVSRERPWCDSNAQPTD